MPVSAVHVSPFAQVGPRLVSLGYSAIAIAPGSKAPGIYDWGRWKIAPEWTKKWTDQLPTDQEVKDWVEAPGAGVGVATGGHSRLVVVDLDTQRQDIIDALLSVLPPTTVRKFGSKGESLFYRAADDVSFTSKNYRIYHGTDDRFGEGVLDWLYTGRQTVLPPTIHPETKKAYIWSGDHRLDELEPQDLPEITDEDFAKVMDVLRSFGWDARREPKHRTANASSTSLDTAHGSLNSMALANLDAWVPALGTALYDLRRTGSGWECIAAWHPDSQGRPLSERSHSLSIHPSGIRDFGLDEGLSPLDLVMASCSCSLDVAFKFLSDQLGWAKANGGQVVDMLEAPSTPPLVVPVVMSEEDWQETIEEDLEDEPEETYTVPELPDELTRVPGVLGAMIDYYEATSRTPSRAMALAAAIAIAGTAVGRYWATPTYSATHVYFSVLADTGFGKQHIIDASRALMRKGGMGHHLAGGFGSAAGLISILERSPLALVPYDELGSKLKGWNSERAATHVHDLSGILRSVFGISFSEYVTEELKTKSSVTINAPALTILGFSTTKAFWSALPDGEVENGFLNRWLVIGLGKRPAKRAPEYNWRNPPEALIQQLHALYEGEAGELENGQRNVADIMPDPHPVAWTGDVEAAFGAFEDDMLKRIDKDPDFGSFYSRTAELSLRLATIRALGIDPSKPCITMDDLKWGQAVALYSADLMRTEGAEIIGASEVQQLRRAIFEMVRRAGRKGIAKRDIHRSAVGRKHSSKFLQEVIDGMVTQTEQLEAPIQVGRQFIYTIRKDDK